MVTLGECQCCPCGSNKPWLQITALYSSKVNYYSHSVNDLFCWYINMCIFSRICSVLVMLQLCDALSGSEPSVWTRPVSDERFFCRRTEQKPFDGTGKWHQGWLVVSYFKKNYVLVCYCSFFTSVVNQLRPRIVKRGAIPQIFHDRLIVRNLSKLNSSFSVPRAALISDCVALSQTPAEAAPLWTWGLYVAWCACLPPLFCW